ncbi:hypothetical protein BLL42_22250 [Pseudomonas frederiksbergensis]|uniref:Uncharacterized protein n=1 Tax=Pseudomonas frederiksbergensis TaxID=104087 RepID=A0A1J0EQM1_9PSED|nr:hypothetical protein [Pseudomonas frederiksbergensis]APC18310.1 hypothetical protein BLL42_22250 [Pseudomonas frederiksbergensis]
MASGWAKRSRQFKGMLIAHALADVANVDHTGASLARWRDSVLPPLTTVFPKEAQTWREHLRGRVPGAKRLRVPLQAFPALGHWVSHPLNTVLAADQEVIGDQATAGQITTKEAIVKKAAVDKANAEIWGHRIETLCRSFDVTYSDPGAILDALPLISDDIDLALAIGAARAAGENFVVKHRCIRMLPRLMALACCNRPLCFVRHELWSVIRQIVDSWKLDSGVTAEPPSKFAVSLSAELAAWPRTSEANDELMRTWHDLSVLAVQSHLIPEVYCPERAVFCRLLQNYHPQERKQILAAMRANERPSSCRELHRVDVAIRRAMRKCNLRVASA